MMKVDPNAPAFPQSINLSAPAGHYASAPQMDPGLPARLLIAAMLMQGRFANDASDFAGIDGTMENDEWDIALHWADAGIARHNATTEESSDA